MPTLHIHLLGDFLLALDDTPVTMLTIPRVQSLLAYLLLHRNTPQERSHLAFLLWPDSTEAQAHTNLRKLLYQLRQTFPDINHFLHIDKQSLRWLPASATTSWTLDILEIEQALTQIEQAEQLQDMTAVRQALQHVMHLYRGDLLPGCYDEWILPERDRFRQLFLSCAERLITHLEQERDYDAAIATAQQLLHQDPLHEATYRQLMRLFALKGNRAAALRVYHTCVTVLERELGAAPGEVTRTAYEALLQSDNAQTATGPLTSRGTEAPLVGRKAEWRRLQEAWRKSASGHPHIILLSGEAGIGKTRLAEEMVAWVGRQGMATASAHCYAAEGQLAYAPVTAWLRAESLQSSLTTLDPIWLTEVARLVPDLLVKRPKLPHPTPLVEGWQRQHSGTLEQRQEQRITASSPSLLTQPTSMLPPTVQTVLSTRLAQLSPLARAVANVAAIIGREFPFSVLVQASGESEDAVVRGLDELWQRRIVRERGTGTTDAYDFSHDKLREQTYASLGPAHRHSLHRRVAEALATLYAEDLDTVSGEIATHFERAGLPEQAIPYYQRAGKVAMRIYAHAEAIATFKRAVALLETDLPGNTWQKRQWEIIVQVYKSLGDTLAMTGQHEEARHIYQRGLAHIPPTDLSDQNYIWQARLLRETAITWNHASENHVDTSHVNARQTYQEAERILEQAADKSNTEWLREWIDLHIDQLLPVRGSVEEMTAIIDQVQSAVMQYGTADQRAQFLQAVGARDIKRDRYTSSEEAVRRGRNALVEVQKTGNKSLIGFSQFSLANRLLWSDHLDEAEELIHTTINIAEQIGNTTLLARCLTFLPFISRRRGSVEEVRHAVSRALTVPEARNSPFIKGHRAWIAWREGNLAEAETYGQASLEDGQGQRRNNPFQWIGLWPLIGIALTQQQFTQAISYVRMLLDPTQQPPLEPLGTLLEAVLHAWDAGEQEEARTLLQQAMTPAREIGYL